MEDKPTPMDVERAPRRKSARAARAAVADQLDSDSESDGADSGGDDANKGKTMRKGRAGAGQVYGKMATTRKRAATVNEDARVATKPKTVTVRSPSFSGSASAKPMSSISSSVPDASTSAAPPRPRPRPRPVPKKPTPVELAPLIIPVPSLEGGESSELTSLTESSAARSSPVVEIVSCVRIAQPIASTSTSSPKIHPVIKLTSARPKKAKEPAWSVTMLKTYVWVLIEPKTWRVYCQGEEQEDGIEGLWWPGKLVESAKIDAPIKVKLFGLGGKSILIETPSEGNILPRDRDYLPRFRTPTFISSYSNATLAPKKKQKLDRDEIETRWNAAVEEMRTDNEPSGNNNDTDSDEFPEPIHMYEYLTAPPPASSKSISAPPKIGLSKDATKVSSKIRGKRKRRDISETSADEERGFYATIDKEEKWDEVDDELDLPGELVLGRDGPSKDIDYWPAQLIKYIPPTKPNQAGKYAVTWLDGTTGHIPRSWFYTMNEEEFVTCKLGAFESAVVEVQNDHVDDEDEVLQQEHDHERRSPSPIPLNTPPSAADFILLSIREQFVYTKPVLKAVLENTYAPAKHKHDRFMKGGKYRQSVVDDASLRGRMDPDDVEKLQVYIKQWCIPNEDPTGIVVATNGRSSAEQSVIEIVIDVAPTNLQARREILVEPSLDDVMTEDDKRFTSPLPTEGYRSSPSMPPSSLPLPDRELQREDSVISVAPSISAPSSDIIPPLSPITTSVATEPGTIVLDDDIIDITIVEGNTPLSQPVSLSRVGISEDFKSLGRVEKIDYCLNILLPEAIRQILLWRTGARTSVDLLSPAEEQDLYEKGDVLLQERDWVFDIMRYRKAMANVKSKGRSQTTSKRSNGHMRMGSASRPGLRNIAMPRYQE